MKSDHHSSIRLHIGHLAWPIFGLVAAALVAVIASEAGGTAAGAPSVIASPGQQPLNAPLTPALIEDADRSQSVVRMLARPLFNANRRPSAITASAARSPAPMPRLTGVVLSPGGRFVIFAGLDGGKPVVAGEGDSVGAAVVEAIAAGQVTLRGSDGAVVLHTAFDEKSAPVSRPRPAGPVKTGFQQLPLHFRPTARAPRGR